MRTRRPVIRWKAGACALLALLALGCALAHAQAPVDIPSADGRVVHAAWQPAGNVERWIVSLHGTEGSAKTDLGIWQRYVAARGIGVLSIQWWLGKGDDYLPPLAIYREIDVAAQKLGIAPGSAMLHGFSRGETGIIFHADTGARFRTGKPDRAPDNQQQSGPDPEQQQTLSFHAISPMWRSAHILWSEGKTGAGLCQPRSLNHLAARQAATCGKCAASLGKARRGRREGSTRRQKRSERDDLCENVHLNSP